MCFYKWYGIHNFPHISSKLKQKRVKRLSHRRLQCWQKGNRTTILPPANLDPSPNRIRHALKVWFNQFPFTSCPVHGSLCLDCIPLLECKHTMTQVMDWMEMKVELMPAAVCSCYHSVCVCVFNHSLSLLRCMTAPCRHSLHTANPKYRANFISIHKSHI